MDYDIAIIGGGPAGYNAAERAAENGLTTVLFEKQAIGGVCLHQGCIPSFDLPKIIKHKGKSVKLLTSGVRMKLAAIEGAERDVIHITCNNEQYDVNYLLLCTGSDIVITSVKGLSEVYYWTSKEILENKVIGCHIVGNSASELIVVAGIAIERKFAEDEFQRVVFPHPTVGETVYESQFL